MTRLDTYLRESGLAKSRSRAAAMIAEGCVSVNGKAVTSASYTVKDGDEVGLTKPDSLIYVGRGGLKLEAALEAFGVLPVGLVCADIGASTGGFTDCLLRRGAAKVYAVDSGHGQLDEKLLQDGRVVNLEGVNAKLPLSGVIPEKCGLCVCDVSFISQTYILGNASEILEEGGCYIGLIKPQFECGREALGKGGIVRSPAAKKEAVRKVLECAAGCGLVPSGLIQSPITGGDGNDEFLFSAEKHSAGITGEEFHFDENTIAEAVDGKKDN